MLYPLKFKPIYKTKIWGGSKLANALNRKNVPANCGESWEISALEDDMSVVANGFLEGNTLQEIIEIYMDEILGEKIFQVYSIEFPLLVKFINAADKLSIQVHPDDKIAMERHNAFGKTELWYVLEAENNAELITGFATKVTKADYVTKLRNNSLTDILNFEKVKKGDAFFIPAGRVHAICEGILLAEIQQTSDITYRIYDWQRVDNEGNERELHTDLAIDVIDFNIYDSYKTHFKKIENKTSNIIDCDMFTANYLSFSLPISKNYSEIDSFIIYMVTEGEFSIQYAENQIVTASKGETILIPAILKTILLTPSKKSEIIEVYIR